MVFEPTTFLNKRQPRALVQPKPARPLAAQFLSDRLAPRFPPLVNAREMPDSGPAEIKVGSFLLTFSVRGERLQLFTDRFNFRHGLSPEPVSKANRCDLQIS